MLQGMLLFLFLWKPSDFFDGFSLKNKQRRNPISDSHRNSLGHTNSAFQNRIIKIHSSNKFFI
jgi:hypothetical protein